MNKVFRRLGPLVFACAEWESCAYNDGANMRTRELALAIAQCSR